MEPFTTAEEALRFMHAGNARVTLRSVRTGARFSYKLSGPKDGGEIRFVSVLNGPDNGADYAYIGYIREGAFFHGGNKARARADAGSVVAFGWAYKALSSGVMPPELEVWHEGCCGRCGRALTVPESIATGLGPECALKAGAA